MRICVCVRGKGECLIPRLRETGKTSAHKRKVRVSREAEGKRARSTDLVLAGVITHHRRQIVWKTSLGWRARLVCQLGGHARACARGVDCHAALSQSRLAKYKRSGQWCLPCVSRQEGACVDNGWLHRRHPCVRSSRLEGLSACVRSVCANCQGRAGLCCQAEARMSNATATRSMRVNPGQISIKRPCSSTAWRTHAEHCPGPRPRSVPARWCPVLRLEPSVYYSSTRSSYYWYL